VGRLRSLTGRLTLFFTMAVAAVVPALGVAFMVATERHFMELDYAALRDKQHLIEGILADAGSPDDVRARLAEALDHHHGLHAVLKDSSAKVLHQSHGFALPANLAAERSLLNQNALRAWKHGGREFHSLSFRARAAYDPASELDVLIALDTEHHTQFLAELQRSLVLYALLATAVSGLLGWFAAHQGLAPLRTMSKRAAVVTGQQMGPRMPVDAVPVEVADLARELNRMLDRLQEDFRRLSEFSTDLAHELRTPISNLLTQSQVALAADRDAATYRDILASNVEEFQRLARMVSDMLFLAKTERGIELPDKEGFSAAQEVQALLDFYEAVAEDKRIALRLKGDGTVMGNRLMFRRAVSNLLSNALRYTPPDGHVTVSIEQTAQATRITVANTGSLIDPAILPRLFDRFYRADPARANPESDAAGLGLPITRAIAEAHGGSATAASDAAGTRFTLSFPRPGGRP
jgi:two-component system heavy metal sensor histidine kinase CusS